MDVPRRTKTTEGVMSIHAVWRQRKGINLLLLVTHSVAVNKPRSVCTVDVGSSVQLLCIGQSE